MGLLHPRSSPYRLPTRSSDIGGKVFHWVSKETCAPAPTTLTDHPAQRHRFLRQWFRELSKLRRPVWGAMGKAPLHGDPCVYVLLLNQVQGKCQVIVAWIFNRSPVCSIDRSTDWTPNLGYTHVSRGFSDCRAWRSSLPDVRYDDTDELVHEAEVFLRRSIDNFRYNSLDFGISCTCGCSRSDAQPCSGICTGNGSNSGGGVEGKPYIPREPRHLRLGHAVKVIAPSGRLHVGRVRYVGLAGGTAATSCVVVGGEFPLGIGSLPRNDGVYRGRRYFLTQPHYTALFVPFSKVVMAWAN
ncbi:hypothetical protein evm_009913 [Chilo suppressalis]|nr:hypothetical protein evm_009913 [Chilo suppressalis]